MPLIDLQRRLVEVGRIRLGRQVAYQKQDGSTGYRAAKLSHFRITSRDQVRLAAVAELYGGTVEAWQGRDGEFEVFTTVDALPILIVPGQTLSQWWELWSGGGCVRRCDGVHEVKTANEDVPCLCERERGERKCKPTTRLSVMLPDVPGLGVWRLESHGYYAAVELSGTAALLEAATAQGHFLPARLRIDHRSKVDGGKTTRWTVPVIDIDVTTRQALGASIDSRGEVAAAAPLELGAGTDEHGFTPVQGQTGVGVVEALDAVAREREPAVRRGGRRQTEPLGPEPDDNDLFGAAEPIPSPEEDEPPPGEDQDDDRSVASVAQRTLLWTITRNAGVAEDALRDLVEHVTGQRSTKAIPRDLFEDVLTGAERLAAETELEPATKLLLAHADAASNRERVEATLARRREQYADDVVGLVTWLKRQIDRAEAAKDQPEGGAEE